MWIGLTLSLSFKKGVGDNQDFKIAKDRFEDKETSAARENFKE